MTTNTGRRIIIAIFILSISVFSCSQKKVDHKSTYSNGIGFQYNLPSDFCHILTTGSSTLELYCTEGKVVIDITANVTSQRLDERISGILINMQAPINLYKFGTEKSNIKSDGNYQFVQLGKINDVNNVALDHNEYPYYIALSSFGPGKIFVAKGFLYNIQFESKFADIFLTVVNSFEPFTLP